MESCKSRYFNSFEILDHTGGYTVTAVRYYVFPGSAIAAVLLTPVTAESAASEHYRQLSLHEPKNK